MWPPQLWDITKHFTRFAIFTKNNGNYPFSTRDNKAALRAIHAYREEKLVRSPNFWFVFKHGLMAIPQLPRLIKESFIKEVSKFCIFTRAASTEGVKADNPTCIYVSRVVWCVLLATISEKSWAMATISTTDFKNGLGLKINDKYYAIVEFQHVKSQVRAALCPL